MRELTPDDARHAVRGGGVLACGGGGWKHHGELMGSLATSLGRPVLAGVDELPADMWVATVTAIGAPAAKDWEIRPVDYVHALQELIRAAGVPIGAVMTAQNGYSTTLNGWIQSSVLGVRRRSRADPGPQQRLRLADRQQKHILGRARTYSF